MTNRFYGYKVPARVLHWLTALFIIGLLIVGKLMVQEGWPRAVQNTLFIAHKNFGLLIIPLVIARLIYRWRNPPQLAPVELPKIQEFAARITHLGLYVLLFVMPIAGYIRVRAGGFPIETLDAVGLPALVVRSDALAEMAKAVHYYGSFAFVALILMHAGAAAFHGLIRKDGIFTRMWPPFSDRST